MTSSAWGRALCLAAVAAWTASCNDVSRFTTTGPEAYCGTITLASSFREGLSPLVQMRLRIDAEALDGPSSPGTLTTFEAGNSGEPNQRIFTDAVLTHIPAMAHDPIAGLEFGDGRERNAMFTVRPDDLEAESMLAVISLRTDDSVEVRLIRPGIRPAEGEEIAPGRRQVFGLFTLQKKDGDCGF